jgi:Xaa-Pro aminopeptidase
MKQDLDRLMAERGLDALVVIGQMRGNSALFYMVNGAQVLGGRVIKKRGQSPVFVHSPIEREEAAASGLALVNAGQYDYQSILREKGSELEAEVELYRRIFADLGVQGRVGFYGMADAGRAWLLLKALSNQIDGIEIGAEFSQTVIDRARATKDAAEAERIRQVGRRTVAVVGDTIEFLQSNAVKDGALVQRDGTPLTIGRVHQEIRRFLSEQGLEAPEGTIFSIGRDAAIPHNHGNPSDLLRLGQTIVFDIYPRELGGYFFDMTRTFCLGYAPPETEALYRDVYDCLEHISSSYAVGTELKLYQRMACQFFEGRGHPTIGSDSHTESGYVHGLSHGIGLAIHEEPSSSDVPTNTTCIQPGHIFTCEPGLYYPDRGLGVRIEDVVWIDPDGRVEILTDFPKELVVKVGA